MPSLAAWQALLGILDFCRRAVRLLPDLVCAPCRRGLALVHASHCGVLPLLRTPLTTPAASVLPFLILSVVSPSRSSFVFWRDPWCTHVPPRADRAVGTEAKVTFPPCPSLAITA